MIPFQQSYTATVEQRYHRLAGPFDETSEPVLKSMMTFLHSTGARIVTVGEAAGVCLWRLRSECETMEETEKRLKRDARTRRTMQNAESIHPESKH